LAGISRKIAITSTSEHEIITPETVSEYQAMQEALVRRARLQDGTRAVREGGKNQTETWPSSQYHYSASIITKIAKSLNAEN